MIICCASGGLDSTGMIYKLLSENNKIHIHHTNVRYKNDMEYYLPQKNALDNILDLLRNKYNFIFEYTETTYDVSQIYTKPTIPDIAKTTTDTIISFMAGHFNTGEDFVIARGACKNDFYKANKGYLERRKKAEDLLSVLTNGKGRTIYPVENYTKKEIWDFLPEDIRSQTITCRYPVNKNNYWIQCGYCIACKELKNDKITLTRDIKVDASST